MSRLLPITFSLIILLTVAVSAQSDSLWVSGFSPPGVNGKVSATCIAGDTLITGGNIGFLADNTSIDELFIWDLDDERLDLIKPGAGGFGSEVFAFAKIPGFGIVVGGDYETNHDGHTLTNIGVLGNDNEWFTLGGSATDGFDGAVRALLWYDGRLYIGGEFTQVGSIATNGFIVWDSASGDFLAPNNQLDPDGSFSGSVNAFEQISHSNGDIYVYAGGEFAKAGNLPSSNLARFNVDTREWEAIPGGGVDGEVHALSQTLWQASTRRLFVGGNFDNAGGSAAANLAVYDYTAEEWDNPAVGPNGTVYALRRNSSSTFQMYVGGDFDSVGTLATGPLAYYSKLSESWGSFNVPIYGTVRTLSENSYGNQFAVGGEFDFVGADSLNVNDIMLFAAAPADTSVAALGNGPLRYGDYTVNIADVAVDTADNIYAVGNFTHAGGIELNHVGYWDGDRWHALDEGVDSPPGDIEVSGDTVYVVGNVGSASGVAVNEIAMWDGASWQSLGLGLPFGSPRTAALDLDGNLWVGGFIDSAGTIPVAGLAMWDGSQWTSPGGMFYTDGGSDPAIFDITVDSATGYVWVCGQFDGVGSLTTQKVAYWDGAEWNWAANDDVSSPRSLAINADGNPVIWTLSDAELYEWVGGDWYVFAGGANASDGVLFTHGCDLYLAGDPIFEAGGVDIGDFARWDGLAWESVGSGVGMRIAALAATTEALVLAGQFDRGGTPENYSKSMAIWKGLRQTDDVADFSIVKPQPGDTMEYGSVYEIMWDTSTTVETASIEISYDSGATWQPLHNTADAKRGLLPWVVPDTNAPFCKLRFADGQFPCAVNEFSFTFSITADPDLESTWLIHAGGTYYDEPFVPGYTGFNFGNSKKNCWPDSVQESIDYSDFPNPPDTIRNFPDWYLFVEAFGEEWCYRNGNPDRIRPRAMNRWEDLLRKWGGSCFGFSTAAQLWLYGNEFNTDLIIPYEPLYYLEYNTLLRNAVNKHWIYQHGKKHLKHNRDARALTPFETLDLIRDNFAAAFCRSLSFSFRGWKNKLDKDSVVVDSIWRTSAHNVVPYHIKNVPDTPGIYYMYFYDSNAPTSRGRFARIDSINNTWSIKQYYENDTTSRFIPRLPADEYGGVATDDRKTTGLIALGGESSHDVLVYTSSTEEVLISDGQGGEVGWAGNDEILSGLNAAPIFPDDPDYQYDYPSGYILPSGEYAVTLSNFEGANTRFSWLDDSVTHVYERELPSVGENDILGVGEALSVVNPDTTDKTVTLTSIRATGDAERLVEIGDWTMSPHDTSSLMIDSSDGVLLTNSGEPKNYTFILWNSGDTADSYTQSLAPVTVGAGATHKLLPDWDNLESGSAFIAIDGDGDGTFEDTTIADVATAVEDDEHGGLLPEKLKLAQNYPNPFNPSTTIEFSLPRAEHVRLEVINVLGRVVTTLVDGERAAGQHEVVWDGASDAGNRVASGVYFYRLAAGGNSLTKKMLLLK